MKRIGNLMHKVYAFENLLLAYTKASRGKRNRTSVNRFTTDLEPELLKLQRELKAGSWQPGVYTRFLIHDPKERRISVAPFRDRVVHHALINVLEPIFEARFDYDSYGCRKGKGMDKALRRAQLFSRRFTCYLKIDIKRFFASIDHDRTRFLLQRLLKDQVLLRILNRILESSHPGLPLGNLTSQWLANYYLTPLDRFLREQQEAQGQIRYMDDILIFGQSRKGLNHLLDRIIKFLARDLNLRLKEKATHLHPTRTGIPFLGFRVFSLRLDVGRETWNRFKIRIRKREWEHGKGLIEERLLSDSVQSMIAHLDRSSSTGLRRCFFKMRMGAR